MEQLHNDIKQCCNLLDSNKVTERKKKCSELLEHLQKQDVLNLLNKNSKSKEGITWDAILTTSYRGLLKEADKIRDDEQKGGKQAIKLDGSKVLFCSLISTIVKKANSGGVQRLSIGPLLQCVTGVLQEVFLRKHFGYTFVQILRFQILTNHNCSIHIGEDVWKDFIGFGEQLYHNPPPRVDKILILSTLNLVIQRGSQHSFLALEVKKKFLFIKECIKADCRTLHLQENLARLALSVCQLLLHESRIAICKFGEEVLSDLRNMYDFRADGFSTKKDILLDWFVLQVKVHHPDGARRGSGAAYADQWDVWTKQLGWLYQLIIAEIASVLRHKTIKQLRQNFTTLAVVVCQQIFQLDSCDVLDMSMISNLHDTSIIEGNPSKRIRLETGIAAVLERLERTPQQDMWPWFHLLSSFSNTHPEMISEANLVSLLQFCAEQLQTCKDITTMQSLYRICSALVCVENKKETNNLDVIKLLDIWSSIWETSLRAIGLNLCEEHPHLLVQNLIDHSKQVPVEKLLNLYKTGAVCRSIDSLNTLRCLASKYCLVEHLSIQHCKRLQEWVLPSREDAAVDEWASILPCTQLVADTLLALVKKGRLPRSQENCSKFTINSFEQNYLITNFENARCNNECKKGQLLENQEENKLFVKNDLMDNLMMIITQDHFLAREKSTPGSTAEVNIFTLHCSLIFHLVATIQKWGFPHDPRLEQYLLESCDTIAGSIKSILMNKSDISTITSVLERLTSLFHLFSSLNPSTSQSVIEHLATEYIIRACEKLATASQRTYQPTSDFDFDNMEVDTTISPDEVLPLDKESINGWSQVQLQAYKVILEYSRWKNNIMPTLFMIPVSNREDITPECALQMAVSAAKLACAMPLLNEDILDDLLIMMQSLCRQWNASDIAITAILDIFKGMCHHVNLVQDCQSNYTVLVTGISKYIKKKKYGPKVCCQFVELIGHIAEVDNTSRWATRVSDDGSVRPLAHDLFYFITSPFHQVRISAIQKIWTLFLLPSALGQQQICDDLQTSVNELFLTQVDLQAEEELEEGVLRTASALHCWVAVVGITSKWRCKAVLSIFSLKVEKSLDTELVKKALLGVAKSLEIVNLNDIIYPTLPVLLWSWHEKYNDFATFPWALLGFNSDSHFFSTHLNIIVPVLIHRRDNTYLQRVAAVLGQSVPQIIESCYPALLGSILPCFADDNQQQRATVIVGVIEKYLGDEKANSLLITKMADVITCMISNLHDMENLKSTYGTVTSDFPETTKLSFSTTLIKSGIKYIQENSPKCELNLFIYLSQEKPGLIQKVLLKLYTRVQHSKLAEYKLLYMHQLVTMCHLLVDVMSEPQYLMRNYTLRWVVRALLHLTVGHTADVALLATSFLYQLLSTVLNIQCCIPLVDSLLSLITNTLVPLANQASLLGLKVLEVLELLLVTHADSLSSVAALDPLPQDPMFALMSEQYSQRRYSSALSHSLQAEIQHVLDADHSTCRTEMLRHLRKQLSDKKAELSALYKELQGTRGFSEDCERSILHQLICFLVKIISRSDLKARYEAARCLGELGPGDLTTLGLKPETSLSTDPPLDVLLKTVMQFLNSYLFDSDIAVVQAASDALYSLFCNYSHQLTDLLNREQTELFYPFMNSTKKQKRTITVDETGLRNVMELFCPDEACSHRHWITRLVSTILHSSQFGCLIPVCSFKEEFSGELFPLLIDLILANSKGSYRDLIIVQINEFFNCHVNNTSSVEVYGNHRSISLMIKAVHIVRKYTSQPRKINYLLVAKAALFCSAYFTAIMFAELWASEYNSDREDLDLEGLTQLEYLEEKDKEIGNTLQNLLRKAYMKIGEPDAVYGCGNSHLFDQHTQIQHYQYEGKYRSVVEACDLQLFLNPGQQFKDLENALHFCGLYHLAGQVGNDYEASWRLGMWDRVEPLEPSHESLVYLALRELSQANAPAALQAVQQGRNLLTLSLANISLEAAATIYHPLSRLQALQEIEDFASYGLNKVADKWEFQDKIGWNKFTQVEPIIAQRISFVKTCSNLNQDICAKVLINATNAAKTEGFFAVAHTWLSFATNLHDLPLHLLHSVELLKAQLYWDKQETHTARYLLRQLLSQLKDSDLISLYAKSLQNYGSWIACTRTEHAQQVLEKYLIPTYGSWIACTRTEHAHQVLEKYLIPAVEASDSSFRFESANCLARYADSEYQTLLNYVKSSVYTNKLKSISESFHNAEKLSKAAEVTRKATDVNKQTKMDLIKSINMHTKQSKIDQTEVENAQKELDNFLILAVKHYLLSLEVGKSDNLSIFRVVSLWLSNYNHTLLQEELSKLINKISTCKVLPVLPQLAAWISDKSTDLSTSMLHNLIERCAEDHPHHALPLIMALANTYKDLDYSQSSMKSSTNPEGRVLGAQNIINKIKQKEKLKKLVKDMEIVSEAYISLANCPHTAEKSSKVYKIPKKEPITKLKQMAHILCPTVTLPVKKNGDYKTIVGIQSFEETYYSPGGINVPKKISCICTDGVKRPQLVKGFDDLRQDAVMQQVFTILNSLLRENKDTLKRRLLIRTYKVVPLSQRSGVIEWCSNTVPLSHYLIGEENKGGAHVRYRKDDWSPNVCRRKIADVGTSNNLKKLTTFKEVCANFKPVFHQFFFEKFPNPGTWFERKLAYTHSVATSSMVGYILGIGDRHILNILIDELTAEVIHIDFGIAFEQGRTQTTAETVPFRLTRDIVDGMGVSGIEGVFRRSCEKTMAVLRECQSTILTILEVLIYDPLYMWTITPAKALAKQSSKPAQIQSTQALEGSKVNKMAERALLRMKQKLQGIEEGSTTSVEGQVSMLIQEATDPVNLSRLFNGWQAHV